VVGRDSSAIAKTREITPRERAPSGCRFSSEGFVGFPSLHLNRPDQSSELRARRRLFDIRHFSLFGVGHREVLMMQCNI
jgi:hypothetical protein